MTESMIYWITRLDGIHELCHGLEAIGILLTAIGIITSLITTGVKFLSELEGSDNDAKMASNICKFSCKIQIPALCVAIMCIFARTFTPTTKEMIAIKVIPQIANVNNIEKIKDISKDMLDITSDWLKDMRKKYVNEQDK